MTHMMTVIIMIVTKYKECMELYIRFCIEI